MATEEALQMAASAWCQPGTEDYLMMPELAEAFAEILDDATGKRYLPCCLFCESRTDLEMFAHRKKNGLMVGWIFVCQDCTHLVEGNSITMTVVSD